MFLSAFAALRDPDSRAYYDRQHATGKTHTQAILRLARRCINVLPAMLLDGALYAPRTITVQPTARCPLTPATRAGTRSSAAPPASESDH